MDLGPADPQADRGRTPHSAVEAFLHVALDAGRIREPRPGKVQNARRLVDPGNVVTHGTARAVRRLCILRVSRAEVVEAGDRVDSLLHRLLTVEDARFVRAISQEFARGIHVDRRRAVHVAERALAAAEALMPVSAPLVVASER